MLSAYRVMWLYVMFDLPVVNKKERDAATAFRKRLLDFGFEMAQFSVYLKYCRTVEKSEAVVEQIKPHIPPGGKVDILTVTDKQYANVQRYYGKSEKKKPKKRDQLVLF